MSTASINSYATVNEVSDLFGERLYGIAFDNGLVKVGRSRRVRQRLSGLVSQANAKGHAEVGCWASGSLAFIAAAESEMIASVAAEASPVRGREYFADIDLERTADLAAAAIDRVENRLSTDALTGAKVRRAIDASGLNVVAAAGAIGCDYGALYQKLRGDVSFRVKDIEALGNALGVAPESLIHFKGVSVA